MSRTTGPTQHPNYQDPEPAKPTLNFHAITHSEIQKGDRFGYKVVMSVPKHGVTWFACKGLTTWDDAYVLDHGDKISEEAANELFPMMQHLGYVYRP